MINEVSIIIVSYNCAEHLYACINSIFKQNVIFSYEVIVVDNDSSDNSKSLICDRYPTVRWIDSGYNAGFSRANNIGIKAATGKLIMILNPDTEMPNGFLQKFVEQYNEKDKKINIGIAGCKILSLKDKSLLIGSGIEFPGFKRTLFANPILILIARWLHMNIDRKYNAHLMHEKEHAVDYVSGACAVISRHKVVNDNLFFDEDFFLYFEDVEWSYRVQKKGFVNYFFASFSILHENSAITRKSGQKENQITLSSFLYYFKSLSPIVYYLHGILLAVNYLLTAYLLGRDGQTENRDIEMQKFKILKNFYFRIPGNYKRKPSSGTNYLKYVESD